MGIKNHIDLIYPELSYKIVGCAFVAYNQLGNGHSEKIYQRALAEELGIRRIEFKEQVYVPLLYKGRSIGKIFLDFWVEDKIVVEIKKGNKYSRRHIEQVLQYIKSTDLRLAILINFGSSEVSFKRIVNIH